jgi:hypothetical protein
MVVRDGARRSALTGSQSTTKEFGPATLDRRDSLMRNNPCPTTVVESIVVDGHD